MAAPDAQHPGSPSVPPDATDSAAVAAFIARWSSAALSERANYVSFLKELCTLLALSHPDPAVADNAKNAYVFERAIPVADPRTGESTTKFIDLYKRGCFILEAKQYAAAPDPSAEPIPAYAAAIADQDRQKKSGVRRDTAAWDRKMLEAHGQAEFYLTHLPATEPVPPFLLVIDVGHSFELYADFTQKGRAPLHFPDPRTYRLRLADLARPEARQLLRTIWLDPASLDPAKRAAAVTREVASHLAELARLFEKKHPPAAVSTFLSRCLFYMFAEDVGLLPHASFSGLLDFVRDDPGAAVPLLQGLFAEMNKGGYAHVISHGGSGAQTSFDTPQALPVGQLNEDHRSKMIVGAKRLGRPWHREARRRTRQLRRVQASHNLREDSRCIVHIRAGNARSSLFLPARRHLSFRASHCKT